MLVLKIERRVRVWTAITAALARSLQAADIPVNRYRRANGGGDGSRNQVQAADGKRGGEDLIAVVTAVLHRMELPIFLPVYARLKAAPGRQPRRGILRFILMSERIYNLQQVF